MSAKSWGSPGTVGERNDVRRLPATRGGGLAPVEEFPDRFDIGFRRTLEPFGVHAEHHLDAMTGLLGHPQERLAKHQVPAYERMTGVVGSAATAIDRPGQGPIPPPASALRVRNRGAILVEEQVAMRDSALRDVPFPEPQLPLEHLDGSPAELDRALLPVLGPVLIASQDAGLGDVELPPIPVVVAAAIPRPAARSRSSM